jgi:hypothetical protein
MKIATLLLLVVQLGIGTRLAVSTSQDRRSVHYEPTVVELKGKLIVLNKYGPPNYGETPHQDQKVRVTVLDISTPVDVLADPGSELNSETVRNVSQIQMAFSGSTYKKLVGRMVVAKGTLFRGHTGHHYTEVVMNVIGVREAN